MVRECRELEDVFGTNFTGQIMSECSGDVRQIKTAIMKTDKEQRLVKCSEKASPIVDVPRMLVVSGCGIWHLSWV